MFKNDFSNIITVMNKNDNFCQGAPQQMSNGFYRVFEALEFIACDLDENKKKSSEILSSRLLLDKNNSFCQSAPQQAANGSYRVTEILGIIISLLDKKDSYAAKTQAIITAMNKNDVFCQGAPQQTANASYRIVEMLEIIVELIAPDKKSEVSSIITNMNKNNLFCQGAPQQSANGTDAAFCILSSIVSSMDTAKKYSTKLSAITNLKARNNLLCQGADQQSANNLYRIMETIQILGDILDDKAKKAIDAYWKEHSEEYTQLNNEKLECEKAISEIKNRASKINANAEIGAIKKEIALLEKERDALGAEELNKLRSVVTTLKNEHSNISIFKFALRKESKQKINEAETAFSAKQKEVDSEKIKVQFKITNLEEDIKTYNNKVKKEKNIILKECDPYKSRIEKIDSELTKKR